MTKEQTIIRLNELLNEEKWTRAALNNYTIQNFKELDEIIRDAVEEGILDEVKTACDEHLAHSKNSIIALYISGIISLSRQLVDDTNLIMLINIFTDNHKWNLVEYLAKRILEYGENKYALRTLADCYAHENEDGKVYEIWERLIRVDYEEADIVRQLAERKESEGSIEEAIDFYKKALHRYVNKKLFAQAKDVWHKLIEYSPEEIDFFFHLESKIAKVLGEERSIQLLEDLYPHYKAKQDCDTAIGILKRVLEYDSRNEWARKEIVECYRQKFQEHSQLEEYVRLSNLNQSWRNVHEAIADFEKHIAFDAGNFVFHRAWGIGLIRTVHDDEILIDFAKKRKHTMSLRMAVSALTILNRDHIWVLRSIWKKERLHEKVKKSIDWALKIVIRSHDNAADMKVIKSELVPSVLTPGEWASWSTEARKILKSNPDFGNLPDKADTFVVRENPISTEEKLFNAFKAEKTFFGRVRILEEFMETEKAGADSEYFNEMFSYFVGFLKAANTVNEMVVASFLLVKRVISIRPYLNPGIQFDFQEYYDQIESVEQVFARIEDSDLKREFLVNVKRNVREWPEVFVRLFPYYLSRYIIDELESSDQEQKLREMYLLIADRYREYREAFVWLVRNIVNDEWLRMMEISQEKILINMVHLLDITYREISNKREVSQNRRINKQIQTYLFKENRLESFILSSEEDSINRLFTLVEDVKDLDPSLRIELKHKIMEKYPTFHFFGEQEKETVSRGFLATPESYAAKQRALQHLLDVEVPENSREISEAREHGDLRENAEYKAAKERQDILNTTAARWKEEIDRAQLCDPDSIDTGKISFGTLVKLRNEESGETEEYTMLGPWESEPSQHIISYLSPFGSAIWNHTVGEHLEFVINERKYRYLVEDIRKAGF